MLHTKNVFDGEKTIRRHPLKKVVM